MNFPVVALDWPVALVAGSIPRSRCPDAADQDCRPAQRGSSGRVRGCEQLLPTAPP